MSDAFPQISTNNILDMESQMNGIAVIRPSFSEPFWLLV